MHKNGLIRVGGRPRDQPVCARVRVCACCRLPAVQLLSEFFNLSELGVFTDDMEAAVPGPFPGTAQSSVGGFQGQM